jgi:hypothetical protein
VVIPTPDQQDMRKWSPYGARNLMVKLQGTAMLSRNFPNKLSVGGKASPTSSPTYFHQLKNGVVIAD